MSVLEIILYSLIGLGVAIYITHGVIQIIKKRKNPNQVEKNEDED